MSIKLLLHVFFEKRKTMIAFISLCTVLTIYVVLQTVFVNQNMSKQVTLPDFVFTGSVYNSSDGSYPYQAYNSIQDLDTAIHSKVSEADCFGIVCRSLFNYYDDKTGIGFSGYVYGVPDNYFKNYLSKYLKEGSLPLNGKKQAVVGYYFAQKFHLSIGSQIPQEITLNEHSSEADNNQYTVSGILNENVSSYFEGSAIISKNTFEENNEKSIKDNMVMGYFTTNKLINNKIKDINNVSKKYNIPEGNIYYTQKSGSIKQIYLNIGMYLVISLFLLFLMISYLLKGLTKKIGLLKAIGISTNYIIKVFIGGLFVLQVISSAIGLMLSTVVINILNRYASNFFEFKTQIYRISGNVFLFVACEVIIMIVSTFLFIYYKCTSISPKIAMIDNS